jgi:cation transport ATPase
MTCEEQSTYPSSAKTSRHPATTAVVILAIILLLLLPVHAYFFAFTHDTPPWLQWMLYSLLSLIGLIGMIGVLVTCRQSHPLLRWLDLIGAMTLLIGFSWLMFHSHLRFQEKMSDSLFLAAVPWVLSKFLAKKFLAKKAGTP